MKKTIFFVCIIAVFAAELLSVLIFANTDPGTPLNAVTVNEVLKSVQEDWNEIQTHVNSTDLEYVVIDLHENVLFRTNTGLSETINAAVIHRDTILDVPVNHTVMGKILIFNSEEKLFRSEKKKLMIIFSISIILQCFICTGYVIYLHEIITKPFHRLKDFAERIAGGNLDIPLEMDRHNIFGVFTESFDIMRSELKKARIAEAEANAGKKELVAKLSHDIKTPVASIRAMSEVGFAQCVTEKQRKTYQSIITKADQINSLVTNLFTASLEELSRLSVSPSDMDSRELKGMLENSDYFHRAHIPSIPECLICADKLRLQQVFDNIFANSYKYADTEITVSVKKENRTLNVCIEDCGGGAEEEELPLLKTKFMRGHNANGIEGAGLGLYISDYFMREMHGELIVQNGAKGLAVIVRIPFSGAI